MKKLVFVILGFTLVSCGESIEKKHLTKDGEEFPFEYFIQVAKTNDKLKDKFDSLYLNKYDALPMIEGIQTFTNFEYSIEYNHNFVTLYTDCVGDSAKGIAHFQTHINGGWALVNREVELIPCDSIYKETY